MLSSYLSCVLKCRPSTWAVYWNVVLIPELYIEMSSFYLSFLLKCRPYTWAVYWNVVLFPELYEYIKKSSSYLRSILKCRPVTSAVYWLLKGCLLTWAVLYIEICPVTWALYWNVFLLPERYIEMSSCYLSCILKCFLVTWAVYWNVVLLPELYIEMSSCYLSCIPNAPVGPAQGLPFSLNLITQPY